MSREERRQYERMMRGMQRDALPPGMRARDERRRARRDARRGGQERAWFGPGFWIRGGTVAGLLGLIAFSLQWPQMPFAAYVGFAVFAVVLGLVVGARLLQRRRAARAG